MIVVCNQCGKEENVTPSRAKKYKFCSKECEANYRRAENNVVCSICGKPFHLKPFRKNKIKNPCCSLECNRQLRKVIMCGEGNHQYGLRGELNASHLNEVSLTRYGYLRGFNYIHPHKTHAGHIPVHRAIIEEYLRLNNRDSKFLEEIDGFLRLRKNIQVHHKNFNKVDNRLENLECLTKGQHMSLHAKERVMLRNDKGEFKKMISNGKYLNNGAKLTKKHLADAGQDVHSNEDVIIPTHGSKLISTNLYLEIPFGYVGLLWSRSGLSVKHQLEVGAGCIDSNYRGEVKVHLYNHSDNDYEVKKDDKIAQLLTIPIDLDVYRPVDRLTDTDRSANGFGSTGK